MEDTTIEVFELTRILLASVHWLFLIEIIIRSAFMFIFAMLIMRLLVRKAIHQLNSFDLLLIIALGSALGEPAMYFHGMRI